MHFIGNKNSVTCAIIKAESENDYYFKVDTKEIMNASLLIKNTFDEFEIPVSRIYLTGFQLVSKDEICSLEKLNDSLLKIVSLHATEGNTKTARR